MIEVTKPHPDIQISPLYGDILGMETTSIDFVFTPKSFSTAEAEIEIKTTEFDSKPKRIRITGNAAPGSGYPDAQIGKDPLQSGYSNKRFEPAPPLSNLNVIYEEDQYESNKMSKL